CKLHGCYPVDFVALSGFLSTLHVVYTSTVTPTKGEGGYALLNKMSNRSSLDMSSLAAAAQDGISAKSNFNMRLFRNYHLMKLLNMLNIFSQVSERRLNRRT